MCIYETNCNSSGKKKKKCFILYRNVEIKKTALNRGGIKMYYRITSMGNMFFLLFFFFYTTGSVVFMSTDGLKSVPPNNRILLGRRNPCPVDSIIEGPSVK